jgi:hypothetical protein
MRTINKLTGAAALVFATAILVAPVQSDARGPGNGRGQAGLSTVVASLPAQDLSAEEEIGLTKMREEEKLARDVYQVLYEKWGARVFGNITQSEQRHMDAIKALLDKYNLPDPVTDLSVGAFTSPEMQELFDKLVSQGEQSLVEAFKVGATIEDLDLYDLYELLEQTDNTDIQRVYENLAKGSRNHLRAFTTQLSLNGVTYEAQFLTQEQVDDIITSPRERGPAGSSAGSRGHGRQAGAMNGSRMLLNNQ